jgi:hypothetical protein
MKIITRQQTAELVLQNVLISQSLKEVEEVNPETGEMEKVKFWRQSIESLGENATKLEMLQKQRRFQQELFAVTDNDGNLIGNRVNTKSDEHSPRVVDENGLPLTGTFIGNVALQTYDIQYTNDKGQKENGVTLKVLRANPQAMLEYKLDDETNDALALKIDEQLLLEYS